jgi:hypothetical protein
VHALFFDPGRSITPGLPLFGAPLLPPPMSTTSAPAIPNFRGSIARLCTLAVYASQPGLPLHHARLASGWRPTFPGRAASREVPL